jgi:hypothetical protein
MLLVVNKVKLLPNGNTKLLHNLYTKYSLEAGSNQEYQVILTVFLVLKPVKIIHI